MQAATVTERDRQNGPSPGPALMLIPMTTMGYAYWLDAYAHKIVAHAPLERPRPPGPRTRVVGRGGRRV